MTWSVVRRAAGPTTDENAAMAYKQVIAPDEETARTLLVDMIRNEQADRPEFAPAYEDALCQARDGVDRITVRLSPTHRGIVFERFDTGHGIAFPITEENPQ